MSSHDNIVINGQDCYALFSIFFSTFFLRLLFSAIFFFLLFSSFVLLFSSSSSLPFSFNSSSLPSFFDSSSSQLSAFFFLLHLLSSTILLSVTPLLSSILLRLFSLVPGPSSSWHLLPPLLLQLLLSLAPGPSSSSWLLLLSLPLNASSSLPSFFLSTFFP